MRQKNSASSASAGPVAGYGNAIGGYAAQAAQRMAQALQQLQGVGAGQTGNMKTPKGRALPIAWPKEVAANKCWNGMARELVDSYMDFYDVMIRHVQSHNMVQHYAAANTLAETCGGCWN